MPRFGVGQLLWKALTRNKLSMCQVQWDDHCLKQTSHSTADLRIFVIALYGAMLRRDLTSGKLPKDGYLLGDMELRQIIEAFAEDSAIFLAVRAYLFPYHNYSSITFSSRL